MKAYIIKKIERLRKERRTPPLEQPRPSVPVPNSRGTQSPTRTPRQPGSRVVVIEL